MGIFKYQKTNHVCATCAYWEGLRKVDSVWSPQNIVVEGKGAEEPGICSNRKSGWWNARHNANQTCLKWDLFPRLKSM